MAPLDKTTPSNGYLSAMWARTLSACSPTCFQIACCPHGFCTFPCRASTTSCPCRHGGQGAALWQVWLGLDERQIPQGATCLLGSTENFYSFWEIAGIQQNQALTEKCLFVQVCVCRSQRLQASINKRKKPPWYL